MDKVWEKRYKQVWLETQVNAPFIFSVERLRKKWKIKIGTKNKISTERANVKYESFLSQLIEHSVKYSNSKDAQQYQPVIKLVQKLDQTNAYKKRVIAALLSDAPIHNFEEDIKTFTKIFGFEEDWREPLSFYIVTNCKMIPSAPPKKKPIRESIKEMVTIFHLDIYSRMNKGDEYDKISELDKAEAVFGAIPEKLEGTLQGKKMEGTKLLKLRKYRERIHKDGHIMILTEELHDNLIKLFS